MTSKLLQILDDNAPDFRYSGGQWTLSTLVQWYQQTSNYPAFVTATQFGSFTLTFDGKSIAFVGNTPSDPSFQTATVSIDGGISSTITYPGTPPEYIQWYQSPTLSEGTHNITVGHLGGTAVDYALIEVGQNTPLSGKTIVVDDDDPVVQYSGSWIHDTDQFNAGSLPDGFPLHNTTHRSSTIGDIVTFHFSGTSYAVYGIFSWENLGILSATYTLDGSSTPQSYPVTSSSAQFIQGDKEAVNFLLFSQDKLSAGEHTLVINITQSQNVLYMLDYITYTPSFSTLATMPTINNITAVSTGGLSAGISSAASSSPGSVTTSGQAAPTGLQNTHSRSKARSTQVGPVAGGVVGGILLLALLAITLIWIRRRRTSARAVTELCSNINGNNGYSDLIPNGQVAVPSHYTNTGTPSSAAVISPFFEDTEYSAHARSGSLADSKQERLPASTTTQGNVSSRTASPTQGSNTAPEATNVTFVVASMDLYASSSGRASNPPAYDTLPSIHQSNPASHLTP